MNEQKPSPDTILDQYKAYLSDLGNFGSRYDTTRGFFLSVVTALLGVLALAKKDDVFEGSGAFLGLVISAFAILVCIAWDRTIVSYSTLFKIKFDVLREMEIQGHLFPVFDKEEKRLRFSPQQNVDAAIPESAPLPGDESALSECRANNVQKTPPMRATNSGQEGTEPQKRPKKSSKLIRLLKGDRLVPLLLSFPFFFTLILSFYKLLKYR